VTDISLRCYVESETPPDELAHRWRAIDVDVVVTAGHLLTLHDEPTSDRSGRHVAYAVLDAMLDNGLDALEEIEASSDTLAAAWTAGDGGRVSSATVGQAAARLATMRRWMTAEQAVFVRLRAEARAALPRPPGRAGRPPAGLDRRRRQRPRHPRARAAARSSRARRRARP
jgi:hypothetical protein